MKRNFWVLLVLLLTSMVSAQDGNILIHDGEERTYYVAVPENYAGDPTPLILALHGAGGSGLEIAFSTLWARLADLDDYIVAFPDGIDKRWSYLDIPVTADDTNPDDVGFLTALIDKLSEDYAIDTDQIYIVGFSNGGLMAGRLRCALDDQLAAVAAIGATMTFGIAQECLEADPLPFMMILGTQDAAFPFQGEIRAESGTIRGSFSFAQTLSFMASLNGCIQEPEYNSIAAEQSRFNIVEEAYRNCANGTEVVAYGIVDMQHTWPHPAVVRLQSGAPGRIEQAIWQFFSQHERQTR